MESKALRGMTTSAQHTLKLVPYDRDCLDKSWEWLRDPEIRALTMTPEFTREDQIRFFESLPTRQGYDVWGVSVDGAVVGAAGLKNVRGHLAEYWGYIGERSLWGQGLGRQLMLNIEREALAKGYTTLDLQVSVSNPRAISLYQKMGYHEDPSTTDAAVMRMVKALQ